MSTLTQKTHKNFQTTISSMKYWRGSVGGTNTMHFGWRTFAWVFAGRAGYGKRVFPLRFSVSPSIHFESVENRSFFLDGRHMKCTLLSGWFCVRPSQMHRYTARPTQVHMNCKQVHIADNCECAQFVTLGVCVACLFPFAVFSSHPSVRFGKHKLRGTQNKTALLILCSINHRCIQRRKKS